MWHVSTLTSSKAVSGKKKGGGDQRMTETMLEKMRKSVCDILSFLWLLALSLV